MRVCEVVSGTLMYECLFGHTESKVTSLCQPTQGKISAKAIFNEIQDGCIFTANAYLEFISLFAINRVSLTNYQGKNDAQYNGNQTKPNDTREKGFRSDQVLANWRPSYQLSEIDLAVLLKDIRELYAT